MSSKVINFHDFTELTQIIETKYTSISTANKVVSPCRQYIFKTFLFNMNSNYQKKFLEVFHQISCHKNQYLQCYKYYSLISSQSLLKPTFSMKYISNKTLEKILNDPILLKQFPLTDAIKCLFAVAQGMYYLHSRLICHGDLCPSNIIVDDANQCYLVDFGLYPIKKLYYNPNDVFTEIYKDPKMAGDHPAFGNDIYSYGILICQICQAYFPSKSYKNLRDLVKNFDARKYKNLPPFFIELIKECLNENVNERPSFLDILNSFQESKHIINSQRINKIYNDFTSSIYAINLSDLGDPFASIKVGDMYSKGKIVEKDAEKALEYYKKAALLKNSEGQNNYGVTLQDDFNKKKRGTDFLRLSAEQGNIHGMYNYGVSLINGEGVKKDYNRGLSLLKKAADAGYDSAQSTYAFMILNNKPTKEQINEGLDYLKMAMNQGNPDAYYTYGVILYYGQVVPLNMKLSMEYFKIAADLGDVRAMKEYADGNYEGKGLPKNNETALTYYQKAYEKGDNSVKKILDELSQKLMGKKAAIRKKLEKVKNQDDTDLDNSESSSEVTSSEVSNQPSTKSLKKSKAKEQNLKSSNSNVQEKKQQSPLPKMLEKEDETTKKKQQSPLPKMTEKEDETTKKKQQSPLPKIPEKEDETTKKKQPHPTPKIPEKEDETTKKKQQSPLPKIPEKDDEAAKKKQQITKSPKNTQQRTLPVPKIPEKEDEEGKEKPQPTLTEQKEPQFTLPQLPKLPTKEELEKVKKQQPAATKPVKKNSSFSLLQISEQQDEKGDSETSKAQSSQKKHSIDDLSSTSSSSSDSEQDKTKPKQTSQPARRREQLPLKSKQSSSSESSESEQPFIAPLPTPTLLSQLHENSAQEDDDSQNNENEPNLDQPPEELIKQGDRYQQQNLLEEALQCYEKAAERGYPSAYLKCAKVVNPAIEKELKYYEAAIRQKVPGAFGEMRKVILKHFTFNKNKDEMIKYAKYFEKYDDFSDAASLYRRARDKENFSVAYEKAKKNIQSIRDGLQQFHFAQLLEGKKENDLALSMYQKALKNGVVQAEENIKSLKIKLNQAESFN